VGSADRSLLKIVKQFLQQSKRGEGGEPGTAGYEENQQAAIGEDED
jgi:hypothetical protein